MAAAARRQPAAQAAAPAGRRARRAAASGHADARSPSPCSRRRVTCCRPSPARAASTGSATVDYDPRTADAVAGRRVPCSPACATTSPPTRRRTASSSAASTGAVPPSLREFLAAPPVPPAVEALLDKAPQAPYARLQSLRTELYKDFVASGQGKPTDVDADRVVELLGGGTGNPYELTASEALLARWAGIPSRDRLRLLRRRPRRRRRRSSSGPRTRPPTSRPTSRRTAGSRSSGTPPRAQQSLSNNQRNNDANIQASPELGINVYLPVQAAATGCRSTRTRATTWCARCRSSLGVGAAACCSIPVALKRLRRRRRAAWASGARAGGAGRRRLLRAARPDDRPRAARPGHDAARAGRAGGGGRGARRAGLARVTRGLWGDLRGRLTDDDAATAQRLATSVRTPAHEGAARDRAPARRGVAGQPARRRTAPRCRTCGGSCAAAARGSRPATAAALVCSSSRVVARRLLVGSAATSAEPNVAFPTRLAPTTVARPRRSTKSRRPATPTSRARRTRT